MKKNLFLSFLLFAFTISSNAQSIKGAILEKITKTPVAGAIVCLKTDTNSSVLGSCITNEFGKYSLPSKISKGFIEVKCLGYKSIFYPFDLVSNPSPIILLEYSPYSMDDVVINAYWYKNYSPITHSTIAKEELQKTNLGQDVPYVIQDLPSVVVTSDAGTGIGYTGIRKIGRAHV